MKKNRNCWPRLCGPCPWLFCFARKFSVLGLSISTLGGSKSCSRITIAPARSMLRTLAQTSSLEFSADPASLGSADVVIVTVPTPIDEHKKAGSQAPVGCVADGGANTSLRVTTVVYESTVYPGATEEDCVPILEAERRPHPGKKTSTWAILPSASTPVTVTTQWIKILKVVSGDSPETTQALVDPLRRGDHRRGSLPAASIQTAEAAKIIENCQRDINIAFVNELALIFQRMGLGYSCRPRGCGE